MNTVNTLKVIRGRNWGDSVSEFLYSLLAKRKPAVIPMDRESSVPHFLTMGSVLRMCDRNSIVWGSGFISKDDGLGVLHWGRTNNELRAAPARIEAVRGPLTRDKLLAMQLPCPEVYGDPALVFPNFYVPEHRCTYKLGIVPHYVDQGSPLLRRLRADPSVRVIDVSLTRLAYYLARNSKYHRLIDEICMCETIISSSLHGLILADAYGVPAHWVKLSENVVGGGFKFMDHAGAVGRTDFAPIVLESDDDLRAVLRKFRPYRIKVETSQLMDACPFNSR
jgi:pyruvyltransferase